MKLFFYLFITVIALNINASAQKRVVEDATKVAAIIPAVGEGCASDMKPCAVTNIAKDRAISVKVEEWFTVNKKLFTKTIVLDNLAPGEVRYLGCTGHAEDGLEDRKIGYTILMAYYEHDNKKATASK